MANGSRVRVRSYRRRFHVYAESFREARAVACLSVRDAARRIGVTPRTIFYWESGHARVPYAAFQLLRITTGYALPGVAWQGWALRGDALWSPEGNSFVAADFNWWGLTVAMARAWRQRYGAEAAASEVVAQVSITVADLEPDRLPASRGCLVERLGAGSAVGGRSRAVGRGAGVVGQKVQQPAIDEGGHARQRGAAAL